MRKRYSILYMVMIFFVMSLLGWFWEVGLHLAAEGKFVNRGFLRGPWLPIYGVGSIIIIVFLKELRRKPWLEFGGIILLCGGIEYAGSWLLEQIYHGIKWWDYSDYAWNLNGRICAEGLLAFGIGGMLIVYAADPFLERLFRCIPKKILVPLCLGLLFLFCTDLFFSASNPNMGAGITANWTKVAKYQDDVPLGHGN